MEAEKKRKPSSKNIHDGHRDRMRERFLKSGFEAFAPHEKIEYLLFACNPRGDTNPLAHELIRRFGSFSGVLDAPYEELLEVDGVGPVAAAFLKMLPQAFRCYEMDRESGRVRMYDYQDMARYLMKRYVGLSQEVVVLMLLDSSNLSLIHIFAVLFVSIGVFFSGTIVTLFGADAVSYTHLDVYKRQVSVYKAL